MILTEGIAARPDELRAEVITEVRTFSQFNGANDLHGEHDFGSIDLEQIGRVFRKIDYYDPDYRCHSPDPVDPQVTRRVLTITPAEEY